MLSGVIKRRWLDNSPEMYRLVGYLSPWHIRSFSPANFHNTVVIDPMISHVDIHYHLTSVWNGLKSPNIWWSNLNLSTLKKRQKLEAFGLPFSDPYPVRPASSIMPRSSSSVSFSPKSRAMRFKFLMCNSLGPKMSVSSPENPCWHDGEQIWWGNGWHLVTVIWLMVMNI